MEESLDNSTPLDFSDANDTPKYMSGLSTILVASIQDLKDRASQIEFIFCSQLYPNFQTELNKYRGLHRKLNKTNKEAEEIWKRKENSLLLLIEDLRREKQNALDQILQIKASFEQEKTDLMERFKTEKDKLLEVHEVEKKHMLSQAKCVNLDAEITEMQEKLQRKTEEVDDAKEQLKKLQQEIEKLQKNSENMKKSKERASGHFRELYVMYENLKMEHKNLKQEYNTIAGRLSSLSEPKIPCKAVDKNTHLPTNPINSVYSKDGESSASPSHDKSKFKGIKAVKEELEDDKDFNPVQNPGVPTSSNKKISLIHPQKRPMNPTTEFPEAAKLANLSWRDTRLRQGPLGVDPHDDFLDTPMENVRNDLRKGLSSNPALLNPKEEAVDMASPKAMDLGAEDEETQENDPGHTNPRWNQTATRPNGASFKYVEPVRKRSERENLKGFECKQCKKFYDAVHDDLKDDNGIRCEHHEGVSRHRYRYLPPSTPDGFWDIGFDTDV